MHTVTEIAALKHPADRLWQKIGSFGAVGDWHPLLAKVESEGDFAGSHRHVETKDGHRQVEKLEVFDPERHAYRYVLEETVLPVGHYEAEFRIDEMDEALSRVTWKVRFDVASGDEGRGIAMIRQFLAAGIENLRRQYS